VGGPPSAVATRTASAFARLVLMAWVTF